MRRGSLDARSRGLVAARGGPENFVSIRGQGRAWAVLAPPPGGPARVWILGDDKAISVKEQAKVDRITELVPVQANAP